MVLSIPRILSSLEGQYGFCQFGGHDPSVPRKRRNEELNRKSFSDHDNTISIWLVCKDCNKLTDGDPTMYVLYNWATEGIVDIITKLPNSLGENPLKLSLLIQYVDEFLNNYARKLFGDRFPVFLADLDESEKKYFIREIEQDSTIRDTFLHDVKDGSKRRSITLKLWASATIAAKSTRVSYNTLGSIEQYYDLELRRQGFQAADDYASKDEISCIGVQVSTILELIIRQHSKISLEGANQASQIRRYLKVKNKNYVRKEDLDLYCIEGK